MGNRVREMREELGLSIAMLSHKTELSPGTISLIERGDSNPTLKTAKTLADFFGCSVGELFDLDMAEAGRGE